MVGSKKIALCITHYNRSDLVFKAFEKVAKDPRIDKIIIADDASLYEHTYMLTLGAKGWKGVPLHISVNGKNLGCYHNKANVLTIAMDYGYDYAILLDSDNVIDESYLDALDRVPEQYWDGKTILAPEFARPHFDYRRFAAAYIDRHSVKQHIPTMQRTQFDCLINTANYVVPVREYLRLFEVDTNPWTADTAFMLLRFLKAGNGMYVVPGMQYDHLVHKGSHYQEHNRKTGDLFERITNQMLHL